MNNSIQKNVGLIAQYSDRLMSIDSISALCEITLQTVSNLFHLPAAVIMFYDIKNQKPIHEQHFGIKFKRTVDPCVELAENVAQFLDQGWEVLGPSDDDKEKFYVLYDNDLAKRIQVEYRVPYFVGCDILAILTLSKKESGIDYTVPEIDILRILVNQLALASNHIFQSKSSQFREILKPKVQIHRRDDYSEILGESQVIRRILGIIDRVACEDVPVLITGESGTGKELIARAIHQKSKRSTKPLVAMNCAALADSLVESELFGHEKGAFTGANCEKKGKFEFADQSTLFLDEIGDMSITTQAKLLRVLQDGTFQRIGGNRTFKANVRLIAATNKNLLECIRNKTFREDLYYRINVVQIEMPALRERGEDIILLASYFFEYFNDRFKRNLKGIDKNVKDWLLQYDFPGNVRELKNIIERAVILETYDKVTLQSMPFAKPEKQRLKSRLATENSSLEDLEKEHIKQILLETHYNKSAAARKLGIARKTLREKIEKYNL